METKNTCNIYKIELKKDDYDSTFIPVDLTGTTMDEFEETMRKSRTCLKYMYDFSNSDLLVRVEEQINVVHHIIALRAVIECVYRTYRDKLGEEEIAKFFRQMMTMSLNDDDFWNGIEKDCNAD